MARHRKRERRRLRNLRAVIDEAGPTQKKVMESMARMVDPDSLREMNEDISKELKRQRRERPKSKKPRIKRTPIEPDQLLPLPIEKLDLTEWTEMRLLNSGIRNIGDLFESKERIVHILGVGRLGELNEALEDIDPSLRIVAEGEFGDTLVDQLELPVSAVRGLWRERIKTVGQLASRTEEELLRIKGFGPETVRNIKRILAGIGVSLKS